MLQNRLTRDPGPLHQAKEWGLLARSPGLGERPGDSKVLHMHSTPPIQTHTRSTPTHAQHPPTQTHTRSTPPGPRAAHRPGASPHRASPAPAQRSQVWGKRKHLSSQNRMDAGSLQALRTSSNNNNPRVCHLYFSSTVS